MVCINDQKILCINNETSGSRVLVAPGRNRITEAAREAAVRETRRNRLLVSKSEGFTNEYEFSGMAKLIAELTGSKEAWPHKNQPR